MRKKKPIILMIAITVFGLAGATPAHAATAESHCVVEVAPVSDRQAPEAPVCFETPDEVDAYLESIGVSDSSQAARGVAASTVVGTVYKDASRGGASLTFWGSSGCSGVTFGFPSLASGWDNSISSAEGKNGCWVTLYTATNYGGARLNCTPYCASVGSWNDNVKSLVFRPTGTFG